MITETITYNDYPPVGAEPGAKGPEITETLEFNIRVSDLTENLTIIDSYRDILQIVDTSHGKRELTVAEVERLLGFVKTVMGLGYGERRTDPRTGRVLFDQDPEIWETFKKSMAYDKLMSKLFNDPEGCMEFINRMLPTDAIEEAVKSQGLDPKVLTGEMTTQEALAKKESEESTSDAAPVAPPQDETDDQKYERLSKLKYSELEREDTLFMMQYVNKRNNAPAGDQ